MANIQRICKQINTTDTTSGAGTAHPSESIWIHALYLVVFALLDLQFYTHVLQIVVCPFLLFLLAIVLSVPLRNTDSDYPPLVSSNSSSASLECIVSWYTVFYLYIDSQQLCGRLYYIVLYRYSIFDSLNERMINLIRNIESGRSCIGVLGILIQAFSTIFLLYFETVPTVWHFLFLILF